MKQKSVSLGLIGVGTALLLWSAGQIHWEQTATYAFMGTFVAVTFPLLFARVRLAPQLKAYAMDDVSIYAMAFISGGDLHWSTGGWVLFLASVLYEAYFLARAVAARGWARIDKDMVFFHFTNPFAKVVYYTAAGLVYAHVNHGAPFLGTWHNLLAIGLTLLSYMAATVTVDLADTWVRNGSIEGLVDFYSTLYLHIAMMAPLSIVLTLFWMHERWALLLLVAPIAIMHASMQAVRRILEEAQLTIQAMAAALEERDQYTAGHSERVARYAGAIAAFMGLSNDEVAKIENAGRIHDLGKIDIPDNILRKPCGLDDDEYAVMKTHTERTLDYSHKYKRLGKQIPFGMAALHHEKYDGTGYVYGLSGEDIPLGSRILSVADTWDAMTSDRPYRKGLGDAEGLRRLEAAAGTQFDPEVVEAFLACHAAGLITDVVRKWQAEEQTRQEERQREKERRAGKAGGEGP